jgi:hypothetical protein
MTSENIAAATPPLFLLALASQSVWFNLQQLSCSSLLLNFSLCCRAFPCVSGQQRESFGILSTGPNSVEQNAGDWGWHSDRFDFLLTRDKVANIEAQPPVPKHVV